MVENIPASGESTTPWSGGEHRTEASQINDERISFHVMSSLHVHCSLSTNHGGPQQFDESIVLAAGADGNANGRISKAWYGRAVADKHALSP
jgi:hypothetical protein